MKVALEFSVYAVVFEKLELHGKKNKGSKRQRLHLWKAQEVQRIVEHKAHLNGMHFSHVCAWGTSKLAFDGSGTVDRSESNYSLCKFARKGTPDKPFKEYNCDLNASYNIGARYFVRELEKEYLKSTLATKWLDAQAKVSGLSKRSTCTLNSLISLNAVMGSSDLIC